MASSFVEYRGYGFWVSDSLLQIWLYFLTNQINLSENNAAWLEEAGKEWGIQAQGICTGCIYVGLDDFITTLEQKRTLIHLSHETQNTLRSYGSFLKKEKLNRLDWGADLKTTWTVDISIKELIHIGNQFVSLLQGKLQSRAETQPPFDPIQTTRHFLQDHCADAKDLNDLIYRINLQALTYSRPLVLGLKGIENLLSDRPPGELLLELVTQDANIQLDPPSNEQAKEWLDWLAQEIKKALHKNLKPFQPIRTKLERIIEPEDERFPHDLLLYPTDQPIPEYWFDKWPESNRFYKAFKEAWDRKTCLTCNTPTMRSYFRKKLIRAQTNSASDPTVTCFYDTFTVFKCKTCDRGWTEYNGNVTEIDFGSM